METSGNSGDDVHNDSRQVWAFSHASGWSRTNDPAPDCGAGKTVFQEISDAGRGAGGSRADD